MLSLCVLRRINTESYPAPSPDPPTPFKSKSAILYMVQHDKRFNIWVMGSFLGEEKSTILFLSPTLIYICYSETTNATENNKRYWNQ